MKGRGWGVGEREEGGGSGEEWERGARGEGDSRDGWEGVGIGEVAGAGEWEREKSEKKVGEWEGGVNEGGAVEYER